MKYDTITTTMAISRCSVITGSALIRCMRARYALNKVITSNPQDTHTVTAVCRGSHRSGKAKLSATTSFVTNVQIVAAQIWSLVESGSASCAI